MQDISWFDPVYSSQRVFRKLLDCMARPGKVVAIREFVASAWNLTCVAAVALTLMDEETTFATLGPDWEEFASFCKFHTGSKLVTAEKADFVFIDGNYYSSELEKVSRGNLLFPEQGATVICRVSGIYSGVFRTELEGLALCLKGPGILNERELTVTGLTKENLACLKKLNSEFPLGVDTILVSLNGQLSCIPRSSNIKWD